MSESPLDQVSALIRATAEEFVDSMVTALIEKGYCADVASASREVAIQATFNATVMFQSMPDNMKHVFADTLRGASGG